MKIRLEILQLKTSPTPDLTIHYLSSRSSSETSASAPSTGLLVIHLLTIYAATKIKVFETLKRRQMKLHSFTCRLPTTNTTNKLNRAVQTNNRPNI